MFVLLVRIGENWYSIHRMLNSYEYEMWTSCYLSKSNYKLILKTTWSIQQNLNTNIMTDWINGDKHLGLMIVLGGNGDTKISLKIEIWMNISIQI